MDKIINNFISGAKKNKNENKQKEDNKNNLKCDVIKKEIKCIDCKEKEENEINNHKDNNIFNSVDKEHLLQLLILPNKYGFNEKNENIN